MPGKKLADENYIIKENSWIAAIAAKKLKTDSVAIVFGNTIHLYRTGKEEFLKNEKWVKHELCQIQQYREHGYARFIIKYLWESIFNGYFNNKFEVQARAAEEL